MRATLRGEASRPLFSEVPQGNLNAFVVHLLVLGRGLLATPGAAMEELDHVRNRGGGAPLVECFNPRRRADVSALHGF